MIPTSMHIFGSLWFFWGSPVRDPAMTDNGRLSLTLYGFALGPYLFSVMVRGK